MKKASCLRHLVLVLRVGAWVLAGAAGPGCAQMPRLAAIPAAPCALTSSSSDAWSVFILNDNCPDYTWGINEQTVRKTLADLVAAHRDVMNQTDDEPPESRDRYNMIAWWTLEPCHELVLGQPDDWMPKMALAKSASGDLAVAYLPDNAEITIDMKAFPAPMQAKWFNPITREYQTVSGTIAVANKHTFARPSGWQDALLLLTRQNRH